MLQMVKPSCWKPLHVPFNLTNVKRVDKLSNTNTMRLNLKGNKGLEICYLKQKFRGDFKNGCSFGEASP